MRHLEDARLAAASLRTAADQFWVPFRKMSKPIAEVGTRCGGT